MKGIDTGKTQELKIEEKIRHLIGTPFQNATPSHENCIGEYYMLGITYKKLGAEIESSKCDKILLTWGCSPLGII